jgi:protein CMS1
MTGGEAPKGLSAKLDKKRKRQAEESTKQDKPETAPAGASAAGGDESNKKKRKKNKKNKQQPEQDGKSQDRKGGVDESIGKMDGRLLADYFAQRAQKLDKELSAVELSDLSVPGMYQVLPEYLLLPIWVNDRRRLCFPRYHVVFRLQNSGEAPRFPQGI